mgnify:CR=1 FL=1
MPKNSCIMQIWAESGKSALPICNYSQILYQFLTFTQNLKRSQIDLYPILYFQIFMSDKIDMVISVALPPVASLSAPMLVAKKYVLSAVSI